MPQKSSFLHLQPDQTKVTWKEWLAKNIDNPFSKPHWHGGGMKGRNTYDFSNAVLKDMLISDAFAEGLNFSNANFTDVVFEEGDFSRADFSGCNFINTRFNKTIFTDANFQGAIFENCNLNRVNLSNSNFRVKSIKDTVVYGISAWDLEIDDTSEQSNLIIEKTYDFYSDMVAEERIPMAVDDIELAQFVYYLNNHKKLRDTLNILNDRGVLLLGRFREGGLERLYKVKDWFKARNYLPMVFDFDRPDNLDVTETILTMSGLSKFVIADMSGASVPLELHAITINIGKPTLIYHTHDPFSMMSDVARKSDYIEYMNFDGTFETLEPILERKLPQLEQEYQARLNKLAGTRLVTPNESFPIAWNLHNRSSKRLSQVEGLAGEAQNIGGEVFFYQSDILLEPSGNEKEVFEPGDVVYWRSPSDPKKAGILFMYGNTSYGDGSTPRTSSPGLKVGKIYNWKKLAAIKTGEQLELKY